MIFVAFSYLSLQIIESIKLFLFGLEIHRKLMFRNRFCHSWMGNLADRYRSSYGMFYRLLYIHLLMQLFQLNSFGIKHHIQSRVIISLSYQARPQDSRTYMGIWKSGKKQICKIQNRIHEWWVKCWYILPWWWLVLVFVCLFRFVWIFSN